MNTEPTAEEWKQLLQLVLAQRLELNAIESALTGAGIVDRAQIKQLRRQALDTAQAWTSLPGDDALKLLRVHSSPDATMQFPPASLVP